MIESISPTDWIRGLRGVRRGEFVGRYSDLNVEVLSWGERPGEGPVIETPAKSWSCGGVYACSFCRELCHTDFHVNFNQVLTSPFVVTCGPCKKSADL